MQKTDGTLSPCGTVPGLRPATERARVAAGWREGVKFRPIQRLGCGSTLIQLDSMNPVGNRPRFTHHFFMSTSELERLSIVIEIGKMPVRINAADPQFIDLLERRYSGYIGSAEGPVPEIEFDVDLQANASSDPNADVRVTQRGGRWKLERGDFLAEWEPAKRRGWIRQAPSQYSMDAVLRIVHTLVLAEKGGFLLHSASAIRNNKAFLFAGVSEAGKTTISRLAPSDVTLLTDEISYVRRVGEGYRAFGTPFTGELAKLGENVSAPIARLYLLAKGHENRVDPVPPGEAVRSLLANLLFFAEDQDLVQRIFNSAFEFVSRVPVFRLTFVPDPRVWELIG